MRRVLFALVLMLPIALHASFEDDVTGGRAAGVDGAMTAMADDAFALYYNPAAIAFLHGPDIGTDFGRLYSGLTDNSNISRGFLGYATPFYHHALGLSYTALSLNGLYKEDMIGLSYAWTLGDHLAVGVTGKNYRKSIGHDFNTDNAELDGNARVGVADPVFQNGYDASAWGGDASLLWRLDNGWRTGLMVRNVNEPNVALGNEAEDPAPRSWNWGLAREWDHHAVMLDVTRERFTDMETRLHGGYETWWLDGRLGMRAGGGYGARDYRRITAGFSYRLSLVQFDYGYIMPLDTIEGTLGTQELSLSFHFGRPTSQSAPVLRPAYDQASGSDLNDLLAGASSGLSASDVPLPKNEKMEITITPSYATLQAGGTQQFHAQVSETSEPRVFWTLTPPLGTLSSSGLYQAPAQVLFSQNVWVTARSETARHRLPHDRVMVRLTPLIANAVVEMPVNEEADIQKIATVLSQYPPTTAVIEGSPEQEAEEARDRLIHAFGITPERLAVHGVKERDAHPHIIAIISLPAAAPEALSISE